MSTIDPPYSADAGEGMCLKRIDGDYFGGASGVFFSVMLGSAFDFSALS